MVKTIDVPMNRVEGDLEVRVEVEDGRVSDAWCSGVMYRGFENILNGRGALDGLVITPRICGICTTSHLGAASRALNMIADVVPPPDAVRLCNLALMTEYIQSDVRQSFLMYMVDFANRAHQENALFQEAVRRYEPFKGETVIEALQETKKVIEIIAIIGGQWPHSSYMVPGGIVSLPAAGDLQQCRYLLHHYRRWYEKRVLGCTVERWLEVSSAEDMDEWLEENESHYGSDLGFFIRFARSIGLDTIGRNHDTFISYGALDLPDDPKISVPSNEHLLVPAGFAQGTEIQGFDQDKIAEQVAYSWFKDYEGGRHPFEGETLPYASGSEGKKYSWSKAPRYDGRPAETGPLAEMIIAGSPLFTDLIAKNGATAFARQLARLVRPTKCMPAMERWLSEISGSEKLYISPGEITEGSGMGLTEATRGALGHWVRIEEGRIQHYQIITPTAWNASPRDADGTRGPMEEALIGTEIGLPDNPVELGYVVRSFDPCLVCTVHNISRA